MYSFKRNLNAHRYETSVNALVKAEARGRSDAFWKKSVDYQKASLSICVLVMLLQDDDREAYSKLEHDLVFIHLSST